MPSLHAQVYPQTDIQRDGDRHASQYILSGFHLRGERGRVLFVNRRAALILLFQFLLLLLPYPLLLLKSKSALALRLSLSSMAFFLPASSVRLIFYLWLCVPAHPC